jgi:hypothetical protein
MPANTISDSDIETIKAPLMPKVDKEKVAKWIAITSPTKKLPEVKKVYEAFKEQNDAIDLYNRHATVNNEKAEFFIKADNMAHEMDTELKLQRTFRENAKTMYTAHASIPKKNDGVSEALKKWENEHVHGEGSSENSVYNSLWAALAAHKDASEQVAGTLRKGAEIIGVEFTGQQSALSATTAAARIPRPDSPASPAEVTVQNSPNTPQRRANVPPRDSRSESRPVSDELSQSAGKPRLSGR